METPSLPRYNTRARAHQHSANNALHLAPCVFRPITFKNNKGFHAAPKQASNHIPMTNAVINQDTGARLEYLEANMGHLLLLDVERGDLQCCMPVYGSPSEMLHAWGSL
jgi:hypothetical protein